MLQWQTPVQVGEIDGFAGPDTEADNVAAAVSSMSGETVDLLHTQPGIRNVVPSPEDLQAANDAGATMTIQARGAGPTDTVSLTLSHDEIARLLEHLEQPSQASFVQEMMQLLKQAGIQPPEFLQVAADLVQ